MGPRTDNHARGSQGSPAPVELRVDSRPQDRRDRGRLVAVPSRRLPRLSWTILLVRDGQQQTAWEVKLEIGSGSAATQHLGGSTSQPFAVPEKPLRGNGRYRWCVRTRDENDEWSPWSETYAGETGPFEYDEWHTQWVAQPALEVRRTEFEWSGMVDRARLRLAAQGLARVELNGTPVNAESTDPSRTDFVRALYRTYDVTDLVRTGANTFDITLAPGEWERTGTDPRVLAEIVIDGDDGSRSSWGAIDASTASASEVTIAEPFYRERHDATLPRHFRAIPPAIAAPVEDHPPTVAHAPSRVDADGSEPIRNVLALTPSEVGRVNGVRVYDVGINIAGRTEIVVDSANAGTEITLVHGEHLGVDGRVNTTSITLPFDRDRVRQATQFVLTGESGQRCTPWFSYQGFRYFEIAGLADDAEVTVTSWTHHTDLTTISRLETDSPQIDRLMQRAERTLLNNVHGIPEDCPTREQAGWTGDTASVTEMEFATFDMEGFFRKWLGDLRTSQRPDGAIPAIAPQIGDHNTAPDPVWGAALQRVLIGHWHHYGDRAVVDESLPALRRWADYQLSCRGDDGVISKSPISYGHDWLSLEQTPPPVHHTNATIDCLGVLAELEEVVGNREQSRTRMAQAEELRAAGLALFYDDETGVFANGSQGSLANALESGMLTGDAATRALDALVADIRARGNRVSSGFAATRTVVQALARRSQSQVVLDVLSQPDEPGVGAMLDHGPGTFWECWWIDPYNTGTGSLDHVGLGGPFAGWALQFLAGLRPIAQGFSQFEIAPQFVEGVNRLRLTTQTIRGAVEVHYQRHGDEVELSLTVPVGAEATLMTAGVTPRTLASGHHRITLPWLAGEPANSDAARTPWNRPWNPPSLAPVSADVIGQSNWLDDAIDGDAISGTNVALTLIPNGVNCMPVPHAQLRGAVVRVIANDATAARAPTARIDFPFARDLTHARFVYAMIDLCLDNTTRPIEMMLVLHGTGGTSHRVTGRVWPAGWNRIAADLRDWTGRDAVVAIEVGLNFTGPSPEGGIAHPAAFQLGQVGYSSSKRTW